MPRCAFLTIENQDGWFIDDELVHEPLRELGWEIEDVAWKRDVDWNAFHVVVIRSPWDYQADLPRFLSVLRRIEASSAALFNPLDLVEWNVDKHYLFDLERRGIEIVPTLLLEDPGVEDLRAAMHRLGAEEIVVKPTIGANADDTFRISLQTPDSEVGRICLALEGRPCLAQPFMPAIVREGEFSLMYFDGRLSHAILKTCAKGDFRVQEEHGGGVVPVANPATGLVSAADRVMTTIPEPPLYARVDLVRTPGGSFALMELELIEPALYFRFADSSARAFASAIAGRYARGSDS